MLQDHVYNLAMQLVEESKSLKRIKERYIEDAKGCADCEELWREMEKDKEEKVERLRKTLKECL